MTFHVLLYFILFLNKWAQDSLSGSNHGMHCVLSRSSSVLVEATLELLGWSPAAVVGDSTLGRTLRTKRVSLRHCFQLLPGGKTSYKISTKISTKAKIYYPLDTFSFFLEKKHSPVEEWFGITISQKGVRGVDIESS